MEICKTCGAYVYNNKFCEDCGTHIEPTHENNMVQPYAQTINTCSRCGTILNQHAWEICENCISFLTLKRKFCENILASKIG